LSISVNEEATTAAAAVASTAAATTTAVGMMTSLDVSNTDATALRFA